MAPFLLSAATASWMMFRGEIQSKSLVRPHHCCPEGCDGVCHISLSPEGVRAVLCYHVVTALCQLPWQKGTAGPGLTCWEYHIRFILLSISNVLDKCKDFFNFGRSSVNRASEVGVRCV